jgi:cell division transport system permease protein
MKSVKNHISLIIPLFAILFSVEFYLIIDRVIKNYEKRLTGDYSLFVVSKRPLSLDELKQIDDGIESLKEIDSSLVIDRLKEDRLDIDYNELRNFLPNFYKVYLSSFPSKERLSSIKAKLLNLDGVKRVETFIKNHQKIYNFLLFIKSLSKIFLIIIFVTGVMLVIKQIEVWNLEHQERMYIMSLFGAPFWMRNSILVKLSIIDTIFSILLVYFIYFYLISSKFFFKLIGIEEVEFTPDFLLQDMVWMFLVAVAITVFSIIVVSSRQPKVS